MNATHPPHDPTHSKPPPDSHSRELVINVVRSRRIYVASDPRHAELWRLLSASGVHITPSWIRSAGGDRPVIDPEKMTCDYAVRAISEMSESDALLWYAPRDDMKDIENPLATLGVALALKKMTVIVGNPPSVFALHPLAKRVATLREGLKECGVIVTDPVPNWFPD
ncbi:MAG: hypothetical protein ACHREM_09125 [Polyangiales bacterium]